jgi:hypothetical protein
MVPGHFQEPTGDRECRYNTSPITVSPTRRGASSKPGDYVVDADFEVVDEEKKKG